MSRNGASRKEDNIYNGAWMDTDKKPNEKFGKTRFLASVVLSSPLVVFVYSPILVVQTVIGIVVPFVTGRFINAIVDGVSPFAPFVLLAVLLIVRAVMAPCLQRLICSCTRDIELKLQDRILDSVMGFPPFELSAIADGTLVAKLTRDAYAVGGFVNGLYPRILAVVVTMIAAGFALHSRSHVLSISFVVFIPFCIVLFIPFARRFVANSHVVRTRSDGAFAALFDFFRVLPFLRTLDAERRFVDAPRQSMCDLRDSSYAMDKLTISFGALLGAILVVGEIAVLGIAGVFAVKGTIPVGDVIVYQMLFLSAMQSVQGVISLLPETAALREGVDSLCEILSRVPPRRGGRKFDAIEKLEMLNVTFAYPGADARPVVKDFSATFRVGRIVALVGVNGTGKTTLLKLATAAIEPQSGMILVNGLPMMSFDEGFLRRKIGIVFQDSLIVSGTVRENITLRDPAFTEKDIDEVVALSGIGEVVHRLPAGLDTRVGLGGQSLSRGELQRLAIARALIRKPDILVLDEVTNHLDGDARAAFGKLLRDISPGRIVLVVSHDPELIDLCDEKISCLFLKDSCMQQAYTSV